MKVRSQRDTRNYNSMDLAKFICAVLIIMLHVAPFGDTDDGTLFNRLNFYIQQYATRIAVPFFFMASGFFLYRKTELSGFDVQYTRKYVVRILKLYLLWSVIYCPLSIYKLVGFGTGLLHVIASYIRLFIFVGSYAQLWYLKALIVAVCLTSLMLYKKVNPALIVFVSACLYIVGLFDQDLFGIILPLKEASPVIWRILKLIERVISTTRNGLFFGFFFVSLGMLIAYYDIDIGRIPSLALFCISMLLMLLEIVCLESKGYIKERDMYLFLIPSAFFLFMFVKDTHLKDNSTYRVLRAMSSLMFFTHLWISWIVGRILKLARINTHNSPLCFILTLCITICVSYLIYILSNRKKLRLLKKLYA